MSERQTCWVDQIEILGHWGAEANAKAEVDSLWAEMLEGEE